MTSHDPEQSRAAGDEDRAISPENGIHSDHTFHGVCLARPEFIQVLVFAVGVHGEEEAVVAIGHELAFARQAFQRFALEDALRAAEVIEDAAVEDEEAGADQAVGLGLFHEALHLPCGVGFEHSEPRDRAGPR